MKRPSLRASLLALLACAAACGQPNEPRRDLILFLAAQPPTNPGPHFEALAKGALAFDGNLQVTGSPAPAALPWVLRTQLFTGVHNPDSADRVLPVWPSLPEAARLSGRHALGFSAPGGINTERGFNEFLPQERMGGLLACPSIVDIAPAMAAPLDKLEQHAQARALDRGRLLLFFDFAQESPTGPAFEAVLAQLEQRAIVQGADILILFTDPISPTRLLLAGPKITPGLRHEAIDPRDIYLTAVRLGRIPPPDIVQGRDLLQ